MIIKSFATTLSTLKRLEILKSLGSIWSFYSMSSYLLLELILNSQITAKKEKIFLCVPFSYKWIIFEDLIYSMMTTVNNKYYAVLFEIC